ncbi:MAG: plastocyanin/azurin family copper-binding protein [Acidimicrobiia bacterium]
MGSSSEPNAFKFFPAEISVPVGTTVVWRNLSDIPHDATARDNSFASPQLSKGGDFSFTFKTPGEVQYYCSVSGHEDAGMTGVVKVTGAGTPTTAATTPTTQGGSTPTTAAGGASTTTTTAKAAAGTSSSTTTTAAANGTTTTTLAPAGAPASAPEPVGETTTTTAAAHAEGGGDQAAAEPGGEDHEKKEKKKNSPIGMAFASVSTLLLAAIAGKLLASKS